MFETTLTHTKLSNVTVTLQKRVVGEHDTSKIIIWTCSLVAFETVVSKTGTRPASTCCMDQCGRVSLLLVCSQFAIEQGQVSGDMQAVSNQPPVANLLMCTNTETLREIIHFLSLIHLDCRRKLVHLVRTSGESMHTPHSKAPPTWWIPGPSCCEAAIMALHLKTVAIGNADAPAAKWHRWHRQRQTSQFSWAHWLRVCL